MSRPVWLTSDLAFPHPRTADEDGIVAIGDDLRPERLLLAYRTGIFPWPHHGLPLLWFSPDPRMVLPTSELHVARSLAKTLRRETFRITLDRAFTSVIRCCASTPRPDQPGTWITREMIRAYTVLHQLGFAHSVEVWKDRDLVGGLYGVSLGAVFFGESMFATEPDASKAGFVALVRQLERRQFHFIDCQVHTDHLARFGAREWPREVFLDALERALASPTWQGVWEFDGTP